MARRKVPSQAATGADTFSDSLVGIQITDGTSQLTNTNFALNRAIPEKDSKNFRTSPFSDFLTLDTLKEEDPEISSSTSMSTSKKRDNEIRFRNSKDDAGRSLYGSLSRRLEVSINNIIKKYPASFLIDKDSFIVTNQLTAFNIFYDIDRDTTIFDVESPRVFNTFEIKLTRPKSNIIPESDNNIRNFYSSFKKYVAVIKNETYEIVDYFEPDSRSNFKIKIKGNPFSGSTTYTENILVRPNDGIVEEFYKSLDEIEEQLINRETTPKFTAYFEVPRDNFDQTSTNIVQVAYNWPISKDGWNIKIIGSDFESYLEELKSLGDEIDNYKSNLFVRFLTSPQLYEFDSDDKKAESVFQLYGQSFDKVKKYIDNIAYMRNVSYDGINNLPDILLKNLAENLGLTTVNLFDEETLDSALYSRNIPNYSSQSIGKNLIEAEYEFYRRLLVNLAFLYKSKGTRASIFFFLRFLGAPEPMIRIDEYIYRVTSLPNSSDLESDIYDVLQRSKRLITAPFSPTAYLYSKNIITGLTTFNRAGYPVDEKTGLPRRAFDPISDIFYQKGSGWYDMTLRHRTPDILDEENSILTGRTKTIKTKAKPYSYGEEYFDVFRTLPGLDTGYGLDPDIDNKKASFYDDNSPYILNRKNIEVYLTPSNAINYDIWRKSRDLLLTFGSNTLYPQTGVTFAEYLEKTIHSQLRNSHVIRYKKNYIALEDVYTSYFTSTGFTPYHFIDSHEFVQRMSPYWMQILDQIIPSTTLWTGGNLISNNLFGRPKFHYDLGCHPKVFIENLFPNFVQTIGEDLETILGEEENFRGLINITSAVYCPIIEIDGQVYSGKSYCVVVSGTTNTTNSAKLFNPAPMTGCTILPNNSTTNLSLICDYKDYINPDVNKIKELWTKGLIGLVEDVINKSTTGFTAGYDNYQPFLQQPNTTYTWEYKPKLNLEIFTDTDGVEKVKFSSIKYDFNNCSVEDYFTYRFESEYKPIEPNCDLNLDVTTNPCGDSFCVELTLQNNVGAQKLNFGQSAFLFSGCEFLNDNQGILSTGQPYRKTSNCTYVITASTMSDIINIGFLDAANCQVGFTTSTITKKRFVYNPDGSFYQFFDVTTTEECENCPNGPDEVINSFKPEVTFIDTVDCVLIPEVQKLSPPNYGLKDNSVVLLIVNNSVQTEIENGTINYNKIINYINNSDIVVTNVGDVSPGDILLTATYKSCTTFSNNDFKVAHLSGYSFSLQYDYNEVRDVVCLGSIKTSKITGETQNGNIVVLEVLPTTKFRVYTNKQLVDGVPVKTTRFFDERIPEYLQVRGETPADPCCPVPDGYYDVRGDLLINVDGSPIEVIAVDLNYCTPEIYYSFNLETSGRNVPVGNNLITFNGTSDYQVLLQHIHEPRSINDVFGDDFCTQQVYTNVENCPTPPAIDDIGDDCDPCGGPQDRLCLLWTSACLSDEPCIGVDSFTSEVTSPINGQPSYTFEESNTIVYWNDEDGQWQHRSPNQFGTLFHYLDVPYTPGDPVPSPAGNTWAINGSTDFNNILRTTLSDTCCYCLNISFPEFGNYVGTYLDCDGVEQTWTALEADGVNEVSICTSSLQSVTYPTPVAGGPNFTFNNECTPGDPYTCPAPSTICVRIGTIESTGAGAASSVYEMQYMGMYNNSAWYTAPLNNLPLNDQLVVDGMSSDTYMSIYYDGETWVVATTIGLPTLPVSEDYLVQGYVSTDYVQELLPPVNGTPPDNYYSVYGQPLGYSLTPVLYDILYSTTSCTGPKLCSFWRTEGGSKRYFELENQGTYNGKYWYKMDVAFNGQRQMGVYYDGSKWVAYLVDAPGITFPPVSDTENDIASTNTTEGFGLTPPEVDWELNVDGIGASFYMEIISNNSLVCAGGLCLVTYREGQGNENNFNSHQPFITGVLNGQPIYRFGETVGSYEFLIWSGTRWEFRRNTITGLLVGYLNIEYTVGQVIPLPIGTNQWVPGNDDFSVSMEIIFDNTTYRFVSTSLGQCCTCVTVGNEEVGTPYDITYLNCEGESATLTFNDQNGWIRNICTSDVGSIQWPESQNGFNISVNPTGCDAEAVGGDPPTSVYVCTPFCLTFIGGDGQGFYDRINVPVYASGLFFGNTVYTFQTPNYSTPGSPPPTWYGIALIGGDTWTIIDNTDPDSAEFIYQLQTQGGDFPSPIGLTWTRNCLNPDFNFGTVITRLTCDDPLPECACFMIIPDNPTVNTTTTISYTNCDGTDIQETITIEPNFVYLIHVSFGTTPTIVSGNVTLQIKSMCDPSLVDTDMSCVSCTGFDTRLNDCGVPPP